MLKLNTRHSTLIANILAAIVLTLIVNFSYIISMIVDERERERGRDRENFRQEQEERERYKPRFLGTLHISKDGYGYGGGVCQVSTTIFCAIGGIDHTLDEWQLH